MAGVDGCRGAWLVVRRGPEPAPGQARAAAAELVDDLGPLVDQLRRGDLAAVAIDMPIGLLDHHPRVCDTEARGHLGPRRSSVFPAPIRAVLDAADYDEARVVSRHRAGVAPSRQAFNLVPAIVHVDRLVRPDDQDLLVEAHPELAFARLAGGPLAEPKRTPEGRARRRQLLIAHDPDLGPVLGSGAGPEVDLLDAAALTVTADRVVAGTERRLGPTPHQRDRRGLRAEIVW